VSKARPDLYLLLASRTDNCPIDCFCWHCFSLLLGGVVQRFWCLGQKHSSSVSIRMTYLLPLLIVDSLELARTSCELFFCLVYKKYTQTTSLDTYPFVVRSSLQVLLYLSSVIFPALFPLREGGEEGKRGGSGLCVLPFFWLSTGSYAVFSPLGRDSF
jgi:hypothetical protein